MESEREIAAGKDYPHRMGSASALSEQYLVRGVAMTPPVRLSRERWEMLAGTRTGNVVLIQVGPLAEEIDGIVFLPATYVPAEVSA